MDLVYSNSERKDIGALQKYYLDLEISSKNGANTFQIESALRDNILQEGYYIHMDGTEYGGKIDAVKISTKNKKIYHSGRTWRGLLESKIIIPEVGNGYYSVSGEANEVLGQIISKIGLSALFVASSESSGVDISNYKFDRYTDAHSGILKMLSKNSAKLVLKWIAGKVIVSAVPIVDYSNEQEISSDLFDFEIERQMAAVNHMIGLGRGELAEREVVHKYLDEYGNVSDDQYYFDENEVVDKLDYPNCESLEELAKATTEKLEEAAVSEKIGIIANNLVADIGDKITATEINTGVKVTQYVINKIVTIKNDKIKTNYKVGDIL